MLRKIKIARILNWNSKINQDWLIYYLQKDNAGKPIKIANIKIAGYDVKQTY